MPKSLDKPGPQRRAERAGLGESAKGPEGGPRLWLLAFLQLVTHSHSK